LQADLGSSVGDESGARCGNGVYPGGRAWTKGTPPLGADADFFFETYVVPEPEHAARGRDDQRCRGALSHAADRPARP
jgi:hypothetical protein